MSMNCFAVSKLFKNVPFVTSFKMSPFCFLTLYFFPSGFPRKISCQRAPGTRIAISLDLRYPPVCWLGPERSPAEPEGRSV